MIISKSLFANVVLSVFTFCGVASTAMSSQAFASGGGSCHFHGGAPATEDTVLTCAAKHKEVLISRGKIDAGWKDLKHEKITQVDGKKAKEWLVTYKDSAAKDKAKEMLFMFFSLEGNFIAANFTGK